ncbi:MULTISPECIES: head-tail connector protein [unclassified Caballeronia]|uniref:head-tail connector protein n=1 Tax=unclassified Caballeronia TaxID=2646786 RepID=UPI002863A787|nr:MULTISPECIES: head-tail connector protein [unclassified Caballeronia]MDR5774897.1 head-tail connector protein [Caballeronia sp. LZ002]MDR5850333.1 head-tail connector protein [Caballeronia sp. LZ003]
MTTHLSRPLVTLTRACAHLRVSPGEDDAAINDLISAASDIVIDYLKKPAPEEWKVETDSTPSAVPGPVRSAVLLVLGHLYADREGGGSPIGPAVESLLMRFRDPAVA